MSNDATPKLDLPYLAEGQAQKHLTVNEALARLDGLVQCAVESRTIAAQPASPDDGAVYLLPTGRTGADWALHAVGKLLRFEVNAWEPLASGVGTVAYVKDEGLFLVRAADGWVALANTFAELQNLTRLGIGTTADAANPLSAKLNGALLTARTAGEGGDGDLRFTLNKETAGDVLSLLFQRGFSGRAELGLIGDDSLTLKVSGDGASWVEALRVDSAGRPRMPALPAFGTFASGVRNSAGLFTGYAAMDHSFNRGGCFDLSAGLFMAPVDGVYAFHLVGHSNSGNTALGVFELEVNGATAGEEMVETHGPYQDIGASRLYQLTAGDTVGARLTYTDDTTPALQVYLSGHLVG